MHHKEPTSLSSQFASNVRLLRRLLYRSDEDGNALGGGGGYDFMSFMGDAWIMAKFLNARHIYNQMTRKMTDLMEAGDSALAWALFRSIEFQEVEKLIEHWSSFKTQPFQPYRLPEPAFTASGHGPDGNDDHGAQAIPIVTRTISQLLEIYGNTHAISVQLGDRKIELSGLPSFVAFKTRADLKIAQQKAENEKKKTADEAGSVEAKLARIRDLEMQKQIQQAIEESATDRKKEVVTRQRQLNEQIRKLEVESIAVRSKRDTARRQADAGKLFRVFENQNAVSSFTTNGWLQGRSTLCKRRSSSWSSWLASSTRSRG